MQLCIRKYPTAVARYIDDNSLEPTSWKERYMVGPIYFGIRNALMHIQKVLKHEEESRFERLGSKLKAQRKEAEERKKEREVKLTDRVPPPKRPRTGGCKFRYWGDLSDSTYLIPQGEHQSNQRLCSKRRCLKPQKFKRLCIPHA